MGTTRKIGEKGEVLAAQHLIADGYVILEKNWRTGHKEIDLICRQDDYFIFVEVKSRTNLRQGMPEESVSESKIRSVTEAARIYLYDKKYKDIRFDVISIIFKADDTYEMLHIKDAFY